MDWPDRSADANEALVGLRDDCSWAVRGALSVVIEVAARASARGPSCVIVPFKDDRGSCCIGKES